MAYTDHFQHADDVIAHLNTVMPAVSDPLLQVKYVGFVSVAAVTVYEMALKEIFIEFAQKKNHVFGSFTESFFSRINGRIKIAHIKDDYVVKFGQRYKSRFERRLATRSRNYLRANGRDICSSYSNLITWRNDFAHQGTIRSNTTYLEAAQAYTDGKEVVHSLAVSMRR